MARREFGKTLSVRVQAVLSVVVLASLFLDLVAPPAAPLPSLLVVGTLLLLSAVYLVSAFGDRFVLEEEAVRYENRWLARVGLPRARSLRFDAIGTLREHRGKTLFLRDRDGRRFVIDAVADYVELRDGILHARAALQRAAAEGEVSPSPGAHRP